jgi:dTDP-4-dehydrorhamnose 3,5-epimerase
MFKITKTPFNGLFILNSEKKIDKRGYFVKIYSNKLRIHKDLKLNISEINILYNKFKGALRGIHYLLKPYEEIKIVQCATGQIFDVAIDLRSYKDFFKI